jgi:hypothetical protein
MATTTTTTALLAALRLRLLTFQPMDGDDPLATRLVGGLGATVPDGASFPYGALRLMNHAASCNDVRRTAQLEVQLYCQPRENLGELEAIADVVEQALHGYADSAGGLVKCRLSDRDTLPRFPKPADAELGAIRLVFDLVTFPLFITQYDTA